MVRAADRVRALRLIGAALGLMSDSKAGRNLNILVLVFGGFRLFIGGGFI
jgi:hypothetical protein